MRIEDESNSARNATQDGPGGFAAGIRAKLHPPSESFADFLIRRDRVNPAVVQVSGIDSPGLTSSLAIGDLVRDLVAEGL